MTYLKITDQQIYECLEAGMTQAEIAEKYDMHESSIQKRRMKMKKAGKLKKMEDRDLGKTYEEKYRSYGQRQTEKLKDQTRINPNNCLQTLLETEKIKTKQLLQEMKKLEEENTILRTEELRWIQTKVALPPETPEGTQDEDCPEYIVTIAGAANSTVLKYSPDGTWFDDNGFVYKVTAWRYMPEVYQGE